MLYPTSRPVPCMREIEIGRKAGVVGEQVAHRDVVFAVLSEFGDVLYDGIVESDFSLFFQLHDRCCCGHYLGQRGDVENRSDRHGRARGFERAVAEGLAIDDLAVVPDQQDRAGDFVVLDGAFER